MSVPRTNHEAGLTPDGARRRSLRFQLLFSLNAAVALILVAFAVWDGLTEWDTHLREKRIAMGEEAQTLMPAVLSHRNNPAEIQDYIDRVCGQMREGPSPGHHIAVQMGSITYQARAHHRQSPEMLEAMHRAARSASGLADTPQGRIVAGQAVAGDTALFVSEYVSNIEQIVRAQVIRRGLSIICLALVLTGVLTLVTGRLVTRPLGAIIDGVRRVSSGHLGALVVRPNSRELGYLADEFNAMSEALARAQRESQAEMEKARRIQRHLIPPLDAPGGLKLASLYRPATMVAGDYLDAVPGRDGWIMLCVADVTGHGVPAAMNAAMLKTLFKAAVEATNDPADILSAIHERFAAVSLTEDCVTAVVIAAKSGEPIWRYASAGHEPCYVLRSGKETETLESTGPLIGVVGLEGWETCDISVSEGDRVVIVTDGLSETASPVGGLLGRDRVRETLEENRRLPLQAMIIEMTDTATAHRGNEEQADDITCLALEA